MKLFTIKVEPDCMEGYTIFSESPYEISIAIKLALQSGATEIQIFESSASDIVNYNKRIEEE